MPVTYYKGGKMIKREKLELKKREEKNSEGKVKEKEEKEKEEKKKSKTPFDFWTLFDKREVSVTLIDGECFHGRLRSHISQRYDILLHVKNNKGISTLLIRKDVIRLLESDEEIFPVLKKG